MVKVIVLYCVGNTVLVMVVMSEGKKCDSSVVLVKKKNCGSSGRIGVGIG